jgi:nucleoside-diphosphate-sugar epimerase
MYIDDCTEGTIRLAESDIIEPLNIGSDELVTINRLVDIVEADRRREAQALLQARCPQGRTRPQQRQHADQGADELGAVGRLEDGMEKTYRWIYDEMTSGRTSVVNACHRP